MTTKTTYRFMGGRVGAYEEVPDLTVRDDDDPEVVLVDYLATFLTAPGEIKLKGHPDDRGMRKAVIVDADGACIGTIAYFETTRTG